MEWLRVQKIISMEYFRGIFITSFYQTKANLKVRYASATAKNSFFSSVNNFLFFDNTIFIPKLKIVDVPDSLCIQV